MSGRIVILGGYGVFGGELAKRLVATGKYEVIVAGRSIAKASNFCERFGGRPAEINVTADGLAEALNALAPNIVVDTIGPYSLEGKDPYRIAKDVLNAGAHYLDFSDNGEFSTRIELLDKLAKKQSRVALSGVSSVPALSSAIVANLVSDMKDIHKIENVIFPVSGGPRGRGVLQSVLGQVGRPMRLFRGGMWQTVKSWSDSRRDSVRVGDEVLMTSRATSIVNAPDSSVFPQAFKSRSVTFRTGLGMRIMHHGLTLLSLPVRFGWVGRLTPLTALLHRTAQVIERFGPSDGGMMVEVIGETKTGDFVKRRWAVAAYDGEGLKIPTLAAEILIPKLLSKELEPGARACISEFDRKDVETALTSINSEIRMQEEPVVTTFRSILTDSFDQLPEQIQDLHIVLDQRVWRGRASVARGRNLLSRIASCIIGLPNEADDIQVQVMMIRTNKGETWTRKFGESKFTSYMSAHPDKPSVATERFGVMSFDLKLRVTEDGLEFPVQKARVLGIPLPRFVRPVSETREYVGDRGRPCFHVSIAIPLCGKVVEYKGWLEGVFQMEGNSEHY